MIFDRSHQTTRLHPYRCDKCSDVRKTLRTTKRIRELSVCLKVAVYTIHMHPIRNVTFSTTRVLHVVTLHLAKLSLNMQILSFFDYSYYKNLHRYFTILYFYSSQSNVTIYIRCSGKCDEGSVEIFLLSSSGKEF